ncbi:MAG: hypothetical protein IPJ19_04440 [Planctomycetes bacterium]|nr:hypothetical protein [Planctomycetota bacterium]
MTNILKSVLRTGSAVAGVAALSLGAFAQTNCNASVGPDIIVGDLQDIANYAGQTIGSTSYDAVAFGTYSCNIGTVWCNWFSSTNQHPVIDNNLYKHKLVNGAGHFEQIGMSWLKHGFFALSNNLCCSGCQSTDGTHLGVRCSDPYTASRNGGQNGAGPRWQVNATTGVFTYPPANPSYSGSVARRCRVDTADLETSGTSVHYFAEAQYVTQDDATAGNNDNNCSYRPVAATGSGTVWNFSYAGSTVRENPAIMAWATVEAGVQTTNIDIPGDGRVVLGWNVTPLGGGQWHYEYALFNMNSDASIGGFGIPVGSANITNIGFHDVAYHDGDGPGNVDFSGTDWTSSINGGVLNWSTTPFAQNQSANAIRWGTMYTFRFDANVGPSTSQAVLTTFKTVMNVATTVDAPSGSPGGPMVSFCDPGTSGVLPCPCNNPAVFPGQGCDNSSSTGGAALLGTGNASLTIDTVVFNTLGEKATATSIVLQGDASNNGSAFGQGVRCAAGSLKRLYTKNAVGGSITAPAVGDMPVSLRSATLGDMITPGAHRYYQVYYRDPIVLGGCAGTATFNTTQAFDVTWNQ